MSKSWLKSRYVLRMSILMLIVFVIGNLIETSQPIMPSLMNYLAAQQKRANMQAALTGNNVTASSTTSGAELCPAGSPVASNIVYLGAVSGG